MESYSPTDNGLNIENLEKRVNKAVVESGIIAEIWSRFEEEILHLKEHSPVTYAHSLRVGLYAYGIAKTEGQTDLKFPLFAGCGHDIGKCNIANEILNNKNMPQTEIDMIRQHSVDGYTILKDTFLFTGLVAGLHHKYHTDGYGIDIDNDPSIDLKPESKAIVVSMAELIMMVDFFDALTTRVNNKGLISDLHDPVEQREVMARFFPDLSKRIDWLIANKI